VKSAREIALALMAIVGDGGKPTSNDSDTVCGLCYTLVSVADVAEWENGDICNRCAQDAVTKVRALALNGAVVKP
jgi:hypothetical protein